MLIHLNRDRPPRRRPWSEPAYRRRGRESDSLIAVCGLSLGGLATSLFVLGSPAMAEIFSPGFALAAVAAGIIAAAVCAIVAVFGRPDA
jgi:hypothetical protein